MGKSVNVQPQQSTAKQKPCAYFLGYIVAVLSCMNYSFGSIYSNSFQLNECCQSLRINIHAVCLCRPSMTIIIHTSVYINDFKSVRPRYVKRTGSRSTDRNAPVKGQHPLWHSFVYRSACHHNGPTITTTCCNRSEQRHYNLRTNSNRLFHQISSTHLIHTAELITNFEIKTYAYIIT